MSTRNSRTTKRYERKETKNKEKETQTSKTILQLAEIELQCQLDDPSTEDLEDMIAEPDIEEIDKSKQHFDKKSDIFYSTLNMPALEQEARNKGLSLTRLFLSKQTHDSVDIDTPNYTNFQVASTVEQKVLANPETTIEEVFSVPQWSRFTIREIRVKSIDGANNLLIQDYKKPKSTGSVPESIDLTEEPVGSIKSVLSSTRRGRSLSPSAARGSCHSTLDTTSLESQKYKDTFHLLMHSVKAKDWSISLKALVTIAESSKSFDYHRVFTHMTEINQRLIEFLRSPRSQVCRTACQIAGKLFESIKDTRRPEFDDIVELLLMKTADSNKFIRRNANIALDSMIMNISHFHTIRAISQKGPNHKNDLVRISSARLFVCIVGITGINIIMNHVGNDCTRQRIFTHMPKFIRDKNLKAREYGIRLYKLLQDHQNFDYYLKKLIDKSVISDMKKIMKKT